MISFWCSSKNVSECSTSRANRSVLSSLRVILATIPQRLLNSHDITGMDGAPAPRLPGVSARLAPVILWCYAPEDSGAPDLHRAQLSHAHDCGSFASSDHA